MARLTWSSPNSKFEAGVDRGVVYPKTGSGVPWNGLIAVKEQLKDSVQSPLYLDGSRFLTEITKESFSASIIAYYYPEIMDNNATHFSFRTMQADGVNYKLHLVYNIFATEGDEEYNSLNQSSDTTKFTWTVDTTPVYIPRHSPSAHFIIDSSLVNPGSLQALENYLYGTSLDTPRFPPINVLLQIFEDAAILKITDNGDGTYTADGPDSIVYLTTGGQFVIDYFTVIDLGSGKFQVGSW